MKKHLLHLSINTCLLLLGVAVYGQKDSVKSTTPQSNKKIFIINAGIGASTIESILNPNSFINLSFENNILATKTSSLINDIWSDNYHFISQTPVFNFITDYNFSDRLSSGIGIDYQSVLGWGGNGTYSGNNSTNEDHISRLNLGLRFAYHFHPYHKFDDYIAIRSGLSFWVDNYSTPYPNAYYPLLTRNNFSLCSIQFLYGFRYFTTNTFGVHFELAIGSPYFLEGGLTFKIIPHKKTI